MDDKKVQSELEEPIWAVATETEVIGMDLGYIEAVKLTNQNLNKSGIAIITAVAARRQLEYMDQKTKGQVNSVVKDLGSNNGNS